MSDERYVKRGDYWWPADDAWCHKVIHDEVGDIDEAIKLFTGRSVAIQAGGNVGVWANHLSRSFERVYTFEPDPDNYECLVRNRRSNVFHWNAALGEKLSKASLHQVGGNCGAHWVVEGNDFEVKTIDSMQLIACDLIVLDIEGAECSALRGAISTIQRCKPVIHFEEKGLGERYYNLPARAAETFLLNMGYRVHSKIRKDVLMVPA